MKLTTKSRYSLRILIQLAEYTYNKPTALRGKDISAAQDISEAYLEQIMIPLKTAGLVKTIRGCNGGYRLSKAPQEVTVLDILELFEGEIKFADCFENDNSQQCKRLLRCPTSKVWQHLSDTLRNEAKGITLASIIEDMDKTPLLEYII